jgi:L-ribulokinase
MTAGPAVTVGIDFGTLSARAVVVTVADGTELGSGVHLYRHGVVEHQLPGGPPLPQGWALQVPADWREALASSVRQALAEAGVHPEQIVGLGTDFTSCTVLPATRDGVPLCELPRFAGRPHAYPKLWRHHAAQPEADGISRRAAASGQPWRGRYGGKVSSEWQHPKALQVLREDPEVFAAADRWIEAADWIVWQLTGAESRSLATAGYKGLFQDGRHPDEKFLASLHPDFAALSAKVDHPPAAPGSVAGALTTETAGATGLPAGLPVSVGHIDAHVTAAAAGTLEPGSLLAIMGTSTCLIVNSETAAEVPGMCGVVRDGVVPGLWGYEAGQSGVGDIFAWAARTALPEEYGAEARRRGIGVHELLTELASEQPVGGHGLLALDWHSGNRSVLVDHHLSGLLVGLTLDTTNCLERTNLRLLQPSPPVLLRRYRDTDRPRNQARGHGGDTDAEALDDHGRLRSPDGRIDRHRGEDQSRVRSCGEGRHTYCRAALAGREHQRHHLRGGLLLPVDARAPSPDGGRREVRTVAAPCSDPHGQGLPGHHSALAAPAAPLGPGSPVGHVLNRGPVRP